MRLGQRVESLLDGVEITDAERRHSGIGGHVTQSYEELPSDFNFDIDDRVSFSARNALPERKKMMHFPWVLVDGQNLADTNLTLAEVICDAYGGEHAGCTKAAARR